MEMGGVIDRSWCGKGTVLTVGGGLGVEREGLEGGKGRSCNAVDMKLLLSQGACFLNKFRV